LASINRGHKAASIEDDDTIVLRRVSRPPNAGLIDHLLACPFPFIIPERE
jgi:hypothetical protein